jgi:hypothetical protein
MASTPNVKGVELYYDLLDRRRLRWVDCDNMGLTVSTSVRRMFGGLVEQNAATRPAEIRPAALNFR